jgi:S1-C subfamily serine protease
MKHPKTTAFYSALLYLLLAGWSGVFASLPTAINGQALPSLADMLERITDSVVNISTHGAQATQYQYYFGNQQKSRKNGGNRYVIIVDEKK